MKNKSVGMGMLVVAVLLGISQSALSKAPPVAKLVQVEGNIEYSRNGTRWVPVRRTKYLFEGYLIRTGNDGSGKLINQASGESQQLGKNSEIEIKADSVFLVSGNLTPPKEESTSIFQSLMNKFAKAQRYTTVRRGVTTGEDACDNKVRTIRKLTISGSHPDLVWRNACPEYSYRLMIDGHAVEVAAQSTSEMIRFSVKDLEPGEHTYKVEVLDKGDIVYSPRKESAFFVLDGNADQELTQTLSMFGDDVFMHTNLLEERGMHVAAMDAYRDYFHENPDDNDMRPLLIQSYQDLKLSDLRENEARLYNAALEEDF